MNSFQAGDLQFVSRPGVSLFRATWADLGGCWSAWVWRSPWSQSAVTIYEIAMTATETYTHSVVFVIDIYRSRYFFIALNSNMAELLHSPDRELY